MNEIKIVLVDDHDIVRDGLKVLLMNLSDIKVIGEVSTGRELFNLLQNSKPDIIIMDITLPKMSGIVVTEKVRHEYPDKLPCAVNVGLGDFTADSVLEDGIRYPHCLQFIIQCYCGIHS